MPMLDVRGQRINLATKGVRGSAILFLHGLGPGAAVWELVTQGLPETHRAFMLEFPGFGESPPGGFTGDIERAATLLHHALHQANQLDPIPIVAHDYGGLVALCFAARYPSHVKRLVLLGSGAFVRDVRRLWAVHEGIKIRGWDADGAKKWLARGLVETLADEHLESMCEAAAAVDADVVTGCLRAMIGAEYLEAARTIAMPILVLRGEADPLVSEDDAAIVAARAVSGTQVNIPQAGHWPHLEAPDECRAAILDFVNA